MKKNSKLIVAISSGVTFVICAIIAAIGFTYQQHNHKEAYYEYRKLEQFFYCKKYNVKVKKTNEKHGTNIKLDTCINPRATS